MFTYIFISQELDICITAAYCLLEKHRKSRTAYNTNLARQSMAFTINMIGHVVEIKLSTFIKP